jgi:putative transposase
VTRARNQQVSLEDTPYYHCISRCVRRAFLCGDDPLTGQNFDHRKGWLVQRMKWLASQFAIDVCAYAVMSNHYHLVLGVDVNKARSWSDDEVLARWTKLFPRNAKLIETLRLNSSSKKARDLEAKTLAEWRQRLQDISWFMRCLNERIARAANREDNCTGRFWEGRFKSQALLDEKALVTCMAYVDLNPIRAGVSDSLEASDFTSIQERLIRQAQRVKEPNYRQQRLLKRRNARHLLKSKVPKLRPLSEPGDKVQESLPIDRGSYVALLDASVRALKVENATGVELLNPLGNHSLLSQLGMQGRGWLQAVTKFHRHYALAAGSTDSLLKYQARRVEAGEAMRSKTKWVRGMAAAKLLYET